MSKRARSAASVDVNPQYLTVTSTAGAVDDYSVNQIQLPVPRIGLAKGKAMVFEILRIDWYINVQNMIDATMLGWAFLATSTNRSDGDTATFLSAQDDVEDPLVLGFALLHKGDPAEGTVPV